MQGATESLPSCPQCGATRIVRNGHTRSGVQGFRCRACGRQFVAAPKRRPVPDETKDLIRRLLGERLGLRAIARAVGVSRSWLQGFVNDLLRDETPHHPGPLKKSPGRS